MWKMMQKVMASFRKHLFSHTGICIYICIYEIYVCTVCIQYVYSMYANGDFPPVVNGEEQIL